MTSRFEANRRFLADLFAGPFRGHAFTMSPPWLPKPYPGDYIVSDQPVDKWLPWALQQYDGMVKWQEAVQDDSVPCVRLNTGTEIFAAAFGCPVHIFDDTPPCALPLVSTGNEADRLAVPSLDAPPLARYFTMADLVQERLGRDACLSVPDIQSPFDIAALIWRKEDLLVAMYEEPEAVMRLVDKCHTLLVNFFTEFLRRYPGGNLAHCPIAWAPRELGVWLSEDEPGNMSTEMFAEFCLPGLTRLSEQFGGLFMHCCATADHQYQNFRRIPNLRGINRVFQAPGPRPAIEAFSGETVLVIAWTGEQDVLDMLDMALPDTRFFFEIPAPSLDEAKAIYTRLRERYPRVD